MFETHAQRGITTERATSRELLHRTGVESGLDGSGYGRVASAVMRRRSGRSGGDDVAAVRSATRMHFAEPGISEVLRDAGTATIIEWT